MRIINNEEYKDISIAELKLSKRTYNCLMRAGFHTLYLLIENYEILPSIRKMGVKSFNEIEEVLDKISQDGISAFIQGYPNVTVHSAAEECMVVQGVPLSERILSRPASDLHVSVRIYHSFQSEGIETIEQALKLTPEAICHMRNTGAISARQLQEQLELLCEMGEAYFALNNGAAEDDPKSRVYNKREIDIALVKTLQENYGLKISWLSEWYSLSKQSIYNKLAKKVNKGHWCNKELLSEERIVITRMIDERLFFFEKDDVKYYLVNNMKDNCAYLIISAEDIKCFFLVDLPEALQVRIKTQNLHRFTGPMSRFSAS